MKIKSTLTKLKSEERENRKNIIVDAAERVFSTKPFNRVSMREIEALKAVVKSAGGEPTPYQVDQMRYQQWEQVNDILDHPLTESYSARVIPDFQWAQWVDPAKAVQQTITRSDVRLKNYPYRRRPVDDGR